MAGETQTCAIGILTKYAIRDTQYSPIALYNRRGLSTNQPILCKTNPILSASGGFQMNLTSLITVDYENETLGEHGKNKPNSKPIKPNQTQNKPNTNPIRTQSNPIFSRGKMNRSSDKYIYKALEIAEALMSTANEGEAVSNDDGCSILFAVMRDCAYKIRKQAQRQSSHINLPGTR